MGMTKTHWMLCAGDDFLAARDSVLAFFDKSILLFYDTIEAVERDSWPASTETFWSALEEGIAENRVVLHGLLDDLRAEGCQDFNDLTSLPVGYPSKVLHLIAHLLDGFIGIDTVFYNMVEDSHWLSEGLRETVVKAPARFWLIRVEAGFRSEATAAFIHRGENNK